MADRGDTHYHVPNLNKWFAFAAVLLLVSSVWMVIDDWNAPWKEYQAEFREIEAERTREALASAEIQAEIAAADRLQSELRAAEEGLSERREVKQALDEELFLEKGELFNLAESTKKAKQELAWDRFLIEEHRVHYDDPSYGEEELDESLQAFLDLQGRVEIQKAKVEALEAKAQAMVAEIKEVESELKGSTKNMSLLEKKLESLDPDDPAKKIANIIRDFPGLDFIDPRNRVEKQVLSDLSVELNFTKGARIDMCQTCHQAVEREGFTSDWVSDDGERLDHPFLSHPNLDLYLSATSPHPLNEVGCTICHRGSGQSLSFQHVDHRPSSEEEAEEWSEEYHWHKQHHWDYPMLSSEYIEASCVQCHKDSMELIAEDAPRVSEGYRLYEQKGCYACHKVEWYPTERKPAPTLANLQAKLDADWLDAWITNPKQFRPSTDMPRIFNQSNTRPDEEIVESAWGAGRPILGQEWEDSAIASVTAYLIETAPRNAYPEPPVEGDAERGREVFRVAGCLACHNMAPYPGEETPTRDFAFELLDENEHGPNLRGVATKVDRNWLYAWIKDPTAYWPETRMPNLRLSDQDAADVTSYIMDDPDGIFSEVPEGWEEDRTEADLEVLQEQARWFFSRLGRTELERRFTGENPEARWDQKDELLVAVGEKFVGHQGCFTCHTINGFEDTNPIGTELTTWGSKTVDKLDWAFLANHLQEEKDWSFQEREQFKQYRENWIEKKLEDPRQFDKGKVKNPIERLRMPHFDLSDEEILALSTFVVGLVDDEVQQAKMVPDRGEIAMNHGMQVVRQQNCKACHTIDPGSVTFRDSAGHERTVAAELLPLPDDSLPPVQRDLETLQAGIEGWEDWNETELDEVGFRLLETAPGLGLVGDSLFREPDEIVAVGAPDGGDFVQAILRYYSGGIEMFDAEAGEDEDPYWYWNLGEEGEVEDVDGELRYYGDEHYDKVRWTFAPPVLFDEGNKVQRDWFFSFLLDPSTLRPQMRVKMPTFNISPAEAGAVADYFAHKAEEEWPPHYARTLRTALGLGTKPAFDVAGLPYPRMANHVIDGTGITLEDMADRTGLKPQVVKGIEQGSAADIDANFSRIHAHGEEVDFRMNPAVNPFHQLTSRRLPSHEGHELAGRRIAVEAVNCFTCHWLEGEGPTQMDAPIAWAPDLALTRDRLREEWVQDWLWNPALIYPGTTMPANFASLPPQYQEAYPDSTNAEQIDAVLDWLYNLDRVPSPGSN